MDIKRYGYLKTAGATLNFNLTNEENKKEIVNKRLKNLLLNTIIEKDYFKEHYKNIDINSISLDTLKSLPPTNKIDLQSNFNKWVSNKDLTNDKIEKFLQNPENFTKKYLNKYAIYQTSGTTGAPVTVINNENELRIAMTIGLLRSWYSILDVPKMILNGNPMACILPTKTPCISTFLASTASDLFINKGGRIQILDIEKDLTEIVEELNRLQPTTLGAYCTYVEMLLDEADKGNLKISPMYVTTVGEKLSNETKERISKTFNCCTLTNYACTECAEIAHMCKDGHYHINDDWIIVEPVDKEGNLVADGVISDKLFVTNLFNYTQPFIRYEMNDRIIMHHEKCSCGCKSPWIEVEGRNFNVLNFKGLNEEIIKISPISIELLIHKNDEGINRYQFILNKNKIELKLSVNDGFYKKEIFNKLEKSIKEFLFENKINDLQIILSDKNPSVDKNGKFKQIYQIE